MALRTSADNAEDVAAGFRLFREPLPEYSADITSLIADFYTISSSLNRLDDLTKNRQHRHNVALAHADLDLVSSSLKCTLEDIVDFFGDLEERKVPNRDVYKRTWLQLCAFFRAESQDSLSTRLAKYRAFLNELEDYIKGKYTDTPLMIGLRNGLKALRIQQNNRLAAAHLSSISTSTRSTSSMSNSADPGSPVSDRRPRNRRSYERARPPNASPTSPTSLSSAASSDFPPSVPEAPGSPVTSSTTSHSADSNVLSDHWAKRVFLEEHSRTRIPYVGERSKCLGEPTPGVKRWLQDQGFEELFQLAFNGDSDLRVYMYLREDDHRTRIVCKAPRNSRSSDYFCLPLNMLEIVRTGSCLQLCRRRRGGSELVLWATFKFGTIEQLVLFFCTFLALRSQDSGRPIERIRDYELDDEVEIFGGLIIDDDYLHALRVYRDKESNAIRLQASIHKGEMNRSPVWTAFITEHVVTRGWARRMDAKKVVLREMEKTIFTLSDYTPPRTRRGEHVLKFANATDAQEFIRIIGDLGPL
ncbi:hypothetical protein P168DRAFT_246889 [Aspergillus campestris IBT 28561]|uniref:Uncharacterized protein n=1 Tax=Aspergillus campestris (strain IBT 28561) TaxID=1392248 RepID=A0A2I1DER1_ASPC2|nr:uncharacterized protein P168DRAFT_246889 [Aspergillus campestris IBT 28561]PKY08365.1 hypothetical protein P168DRAFT_246889 [Aspergillus campestris IBT 28561]